MGGLRGGVILGGGLAAELLGAALVAHLGLIHGLAAAHRSSRGTCEGLLHADPLQVLLVLKLFLDVLVSLQEPTSKESGERPYYI